jgi:dihydropteroate synthase type 2
MRPAIVGIVNVTEDSFSDGGRYLDPDRALDHARTLVDQGADYVEFGPASSHPDAKAVCPDLQIERLAPVLASARGLDARIAVDASDGAVQRFAIEQGIDMLNDVNGIPAEATLRQLAGSSCRIVAVHSIGQGGRGTRAEAAPEEVIASIEEFFARARDRFAAAGIDEFRLILDPGLGFFLGGNPACSFRVLRVLSALRASAGAALLVSASRKSFLQRAIGRGPGETGAATIAAETFAALAGADYIRTHDVRALSDALTVLDAIGMEAGPREVDVRADAHDRG